MKISEAIDGQRRYKILYLITQGILGGAQTHILHLASHLNHKFDVHVAMGVKGPLWDMLQERNIPLYQIPSMARAISPIKDLKGLLETIRLLKVVKPDLLSTHSSKAGILGCLAAFLCGMPAVFTAHGWAFTEGVPNMQRRFYIRAERIATRWARKVICVSEHDHQLALKYGVGRTDQLITIHNGMPFASDDFISKPGKENPIRLIMVARFSEPKDHQLLLRALSEIKVSKNIEVDLVGDGPLLPQCKELAQKLGLNKIVNFLGARTDVPKLLARAQIFILISKWEGFPRSILEAMRAGLPVIASDVGGTKESVINGETGYLIPRNDMGKLKENLLMLLDNSELRVRMGRNGHSRFLENFTFMHMLDKTKRIYEEILY